MHDIRAIRDDPAAFDEGLARRGLAPQAEKILKIDAERRRLITLVENIGNQRKRLETKAIGGISDQIKTRGLTFPSDAEKSAFIRSEINQYVRGPSRELADQLSRLKPDMERRQKELDDLLATLPNLPAADVPDGADEAGNVEQARWGTPRAFDFVARDHADIGPALGLDFEAGARIAGTRFTVLKGGAARLHRALGQFMLDRHAAEGWTEVSPPLLVRDEAVFGTGQLPKFADDLFRTTDGRWLIPTAEVSLTNIVAGQIVEDGALPLRMTALTACFRSEAGAAGRDTRGLIRQHQFEKVELVAIAAAEQAEAEHQRMTRAAEGVLEALELPYRRMLLCAGDMGFTAKRTYDLEVWLPGQNAYREISSCSWCGDFQARRMDARHRAAGAKGTRFVHTLNGSGVAVGRALVAVIENGQQADGSVTIPQALRPYIGGRDRIEPA